MMEAICRTKITASNCRKLAIFIIISSYLFYPDDREIMNTKQMTKQWKQLIVQKDINFLQCLSFGYRIIQIVCVKCGFVRAWDVDLLLFSICLVVDLRLLSFSDLLIHSRENKYLFRTWKSNSSRITLRLSVI